MIWGHKHRAHLAASAVGPHRYCLGDPQEVAMPRGALTHGVYTVRSYWCLLTRSAHGTDSKSTSCTTHDQPL